MAAKWMMISPSMYHTHGMTCYATLYGSFNFLYDKFVLINLPKRQKPKRVRFIRSVNSGSSTITHACCIVSAYLLFTFYLGHQAHHTAYLCHRKDGSTRVSRNHGRSPKRRTNKTESARFVLRRDRLCRTKG